MAQHKLTTTLPFYKDSGSIYDGSVQSYYIEVTGLAFSPRHIMIHTTNGWCGIGGVSLDAPKNPSNGTTIIDADSNAYTKFRLYDNAKITSNGFKLPFAHSPGGSVWWFASE